MKNKGPLLVLACYVLFGILPIYWKLLVMVDPYFILANRVVWSLAFALVLLGVGKNMGVLRAAIKDRRSLLVLGASGVLLVINWGSYIVAVNTGHVIDASLAYYLNPIMTILLGAFFFKERLTALQKLSVVLACAGVGYAIWSYGVVPWLALIMGASFAFYGAIKKMVALDGVTSLAMECLWMLLPALLLAGGLLASGHTAQAGQSMGALQWLLLPTTGVITGAPLVIYARGIRTTDYSLAGILMYINPTLQLLCGIFIFGETFTHIYAVMFAFVWASVVLYMLSVLLQQRRKTLGKNK